MITPKNHQIWGNSRYSSYPYKKCMASKNYKTFCVELSEEDYNKLQKLVSSGRFRTKIAVIRDLLKRVDENE
jgi:hypothetical protein